MKEKELKERWLPVVGWEGCYEVSNFGRVKSCFRRVKSVSSISGFRFIAEKILRQTKAKMFNSMRRKPYYYYIVHLSGAHRKSKICIISNLVIEAFVGLRPKNNVCCHNNNNPLDNRIQNLRWDTEKRKCKIN